jgi:hypothetical protein
MPIVTEVYSQKVVKTMPFFSFVIPKINFYVNTPAVSVSVTTDKFQTSEKDGVFNILNTNTQPIYFNDITFVRARTRDSELKSRLNFIRVSLTNTYETETKYYQEYTVRVNGFMTGKLTIVTDLGAIGSNKSIIPLTKLSFSAFYEVENLGVLNGHYYGKSTNSPLKRVGIVDFTFNLKAYGDKELTKIINEEMVISTILVNT